MTTPHFTIRNEYYKITNKVKKLGRSSAIINEKQARRAKRYVQTSTSKKVKEGKDWLKTIASCDDVIACKETFFSELPGYAKQF